MKKKLFHLFRFPVFIIFVFLFLFSCLDEHYDFNKISDEMRLTPGFTAPVAFGSLTIGDILDEIDEEDYVKEDEDKLLYITYSDTLFSYPASEIIDIPDQEFLAIYIDSDINIPDWLSSSLGESVNFQKSENGEFVFENNERVDSVFIKSTILHIEVSSGFRHQGSLTVTAPSVLTDGTPFSTTIPISDASGNFSYTGDFPLNNVKITLDNTSDPDTTYLPLVFDLLLVNSGAGISSDEKCYITMSFKDLEFNSIFGYLGNYEVLEEANNITIDFFDSEFEEGKIFFYDPQFYLNIHNSYGIPVSIQLSDVYTYSDINSVSFKIIFNGINPFDITAPSLAGMSELTEISIDRTNCNIVEAMETEPNEFYFKVKAVTNPSGPGTVSNFVTDSSRVDADLEIVLPIWVKAEGFTLEDTVDFDFDEEMGDIAKLIDYLRVTLEAENGLPFEADLQIYFTDENHSVLDSMFTENLPLLEPALIGADDKVTSKTSLERNIEFTDEKLENLKPVKYAIISATVNTAKANENRYVKFLSGYSIDFKLKIKANFDINTREL